MNNWRNRQPSNAAKAAAHNFYRNSGSDGITDDLEPFANAPGVKSRVTDSEIAAYQAEVAKWRNVPPPPRDTFGPKAPALAPAPDAPNATNSDDESDEPNTRMRAQFTDLDAVGKFLQGGKAIVTVVSKQTKQRFTFKFVRPAKSNRPGQPPTFVSVLTGPDNNAAYSYMGSIFPDRDALEIVHTGKSQIAKTAPSAKAAQWFVRAVAAGGPVLEQCEVWHEGRCGRCGRRLTVPESIASGFGPECINRV